MSTQIKRILVIGGTGTQGIPIVQALVKDQKYHVKVLTRDTQSARAKSLIAIGNVTLLEGSFTNESDLRAGYNDCDGAFINIDSFNVGEKTETYWTIRAYELAIECGIKFFVYSTLDYGYKESGFRSEFRCGHLDGKGRIGEWILLQNQQNKDRMIAALFRTGPYALMNISASSTMSPSVEDGVAIWRVPLGDGAVPLVDLDDCGHYVRWLFDHPELANGITLDAAIEHVEYASLAAAFAKVTGHPAKYVDVDLEEYWTNGAFAAAANRSSGYNADLNDPSSGAITMRQNFSGWWNLYKASKGNVGLIRRNYKLMDEIHPTRTRTIEEWFRKQDLKGRQEGLGDLWDRIQPDQLKAVLKLAEDGFKGKA